MQHINTTTAADLYTPNLHDRRVLLSDGQVRTPIAMIAATRPGHWTIYYDAPQADPQARVQVWGPHGWRD